MKARPELVSNADVARNGKDKPKNAAGKSMALTACSKKNLKKLLLARLGSMPGNGTNRVVMPLESRSNTHLVCISSRPNTAAREKKHVSSHIMEKYFVKNHSMPWCSYFPGRRRRGRASRNHAPARRGRSAAEQMKNKTCDEGVR